MNEEKLMQILCDLSCENINIRKAFTEVLALSDVSLSLLGASKCPNSNCDNNGTIAYQTANGDWEPEPCEWCYKKKELLNNEG